MKKILSLFAVAGVMILSLVSCNKSLKEITDVDYTRVLTPTALEATVTSAGDVVSFNWSKSKGATDFELEIYTNPELEGSPITLTVPVGQLPYSHKLVADETYYYRVRGIDADNILEPSKWAVYKDDNTGETKSIKTYAIKPSVSPYVSARTSTSVTLGWTLEEGDTEITHILVKDAEGTESEFKVTSVGKGIEVTGLQPSHFYSLTVHFKSANRGSVTAWTRPSEDGSTPAICKDTAAIKQAFRDKAPKIVIPYADTTYVVGEMQVSGDMVVIGVSDETGAKPSIAGRFTATADLKSLHVEDLDISGAQVPVNEDGTGGMSIQTHLFTAAAGSYTSIEFVNLNVSDFQRGLYYDNAGGKVSGHILFDGLRVDNILGSGGDNIDIRKAGNVESIIVRNSTFNGGTRTFMRVDANQTIGAIQIKNNTFNNMCYDGSALKIGGSNVQGLFAVKSAPGEYKVSNNLFLNNQCWLIGSNTACVVPAFVNNYYYNCVPEFFTSAKLDGTGARADISEELAVAEGGMVLTADPCQDSMGGIFNLVENAVIKAAVGDPRWFQPYVYIPEDLTQDVTKAVHNWNFGDSKTFYKHADVDMVRDGIRFHVGGAPVVFDGALSFPDADSKLSIKVNQKGSLVISTQNNGAGNASVVFYCEDKSVGAVTADAENQQIVFNEIVPETETLIYICPTNAVRITALQWNAEEEFVSQKVLDTPSVSLSTKKLTQGEELTVSWSAVANAASYQVSVDEGKATSVTELEAVVKTGSLTPGEHTVKVVAVPAGWDLLRTASKAGESAFEVKEKPAPTPGGTKGMITFDDYVGNTPASLEDGSLKLNFNNGNGKLVIDNNKAYFGTPDNYTVFNTRLKTGGKSGSTNGIQIVIADGAAGKLNIYARTGSNSATDRNVVITGAAGEIFNEIMLESNSVVTSIEGADTKVYSVYSCDIEAGTYEVTYPVNGVNFYGFEFVPAGGAASIDLVWDFSSEQWTSALTAFVVANTNSTDWNMEVDGLKVLSGGGSIKWNKTAEEVYYIQPGGAGSSSKRYFEFEAKADGELKVYASNTGDSEDLTRMVTVKCGENEPESQAGGYAAKDGAHELSYNVVAGTVRVYPTGNGLRFYKMEFHSK